MLRPVQMKVMSRHQINSIPTDKIVGQSKLKAFADGKINMTLKLKGGGFQETLWEKEKIMVTSIFSFSHNVLKRLFCRHGQDYVANV